MMCDKDKEELQNRRLEYTQIMENFRFVMRGYVSATFMWLGLSGVMLHVLTRNEMDQAQRGIVLFFVQVLYLIFILFGPLITKHHKLQNERIANLKASLGLSEDKTFPMASTTIHLCMISVVIMSLGWLVLTWWTHF